MVTLRLRLADALIALAFRLIPAGPMKSTLLHYWAWGVHKAKIAVAKPGERSS